jgi:Fe2+ or Zn2+ uptake regulation protein
MKVKHCDHDSHRASSDARYEQALGHLKKAKLRITEARKAILRFLIAAAKPQSAEDVYAVLGPRAGDLVTVYRTLNTLEESEIVRRSDFGGVRRYEYATPGHHHHYVVCRSCGDAEPFADCDFAVKNIRTLEKRGFKKIQHSLEIFALCPTCV